MRIKRIPLIALAALLLLAPAASAGTHRLEGGLKGDSNASVVLVLKLDRGEPKRLVRARYSDVDVRCPDGTTNEVSGTAPGHKVKRERDGDLFAFAGGPESDPPLNLFAYINRRGTVARGSLAIVALAPDSCATANPDGTSTALPFVARR